MEINNNLILQWINGTGNDTIMTMYYNISVKPLVIGVLEKGRTTGSVGLHIQKYDETCITIFLGQMNVTSTGIFRGLLFNIFILGI